MFDSQQSALPFGPHVAAKPVQEGRGVQVPAVALQTGVSPEQAATLLHTPVGEQVCGPLPMHCLAPAAHTPHTPAPLQ